MIYPVQPLLLLAEAIPRPNPMVHVYVYIQLQQIFGNLSGQKHIFFVPSEFGGVLDPTAITWCVVAPFWFCLLITEKGSGQRLEREHAETIHKKTGTTKRPVHDSMRSDVKSHTGMIIGCTIAAAAIFVLLLILCARWLRWGPFRISALEMNRQNANIGNRELSAAAWGAPHPAAGRVAPSMYARELRLQILDDNKDENEHPNA